ncbi:unnamed protein product [Ectocarpus sp. 12 AP-2014]
MLKTETYVVQGAHVSMLAGHSCCPRDKRPPVSIYGYATISAVHRNPACLPLSCSASQLLCLGCPVRCTAYEYYFSESSSYNFSPMTSLPCCLDRFLWLRNAARKAANFSCSFLPNFVNGTFDARYLWDEEKFCARDWRNGVIFVFLLQWREGARFSYFYTAPPKNGFKRAGECSCNLFSPHSRYPKASNLVPERCRVELTRSGWHCCCCCFLLRIVIAGKPNHAYTIPSNQNQLISDLGTLGSIKTSFPIRTIPHGTKPWA